MASKLDEISVAIGELRSGQKANADKLSDHMAASNAHSKELADKIDRLADSIDSKVATSTTKYLNGALGGLVAVLMAWASQRFTGLKLP